MKKIGVIAKIQHPLTGGALKGLIGWLKERGIEIYIDRETSGIIGEKSTYKRAEIPSLTELIIVLGGDGTLLSVARLIEDKDVPILGVNLGSLGFLTEITMDELYPVLEKVITGDFTVENRIMLDAIIYREGKTAAHYCAFNDVVINRGALARIVDLEIKINGMYVTTYRSDGLIIATPTGSTAYSLAAGGPIVYPTMNALILSPICPHTLTNRPIVIPDDVKIEINLVTPNEDVLATMDGQVGYSLNYRDTIEIKKARNTIKLIQSPGKNYYEVLRKKLKWGERL
ncbi:MAG: NAD(+)/NADH kinase [Nitrospinae bacterium]|nr:NAD(+)/NADH kinase [Nitrospinota bacterium]